ncbi:MAG: hypothetical protein ACFHU9_03235 [Fluviicola sp.]
MAINENGTQYFTPKNNGFIFWEHALKSTVAFVATFALLFFGPLMLGSRNRGGNSKDGLTYQIISFVLEHPEVHVGALFAALLIMNGYIFYKNRKVKYIRKVAFDSDEVKIELTNLYFSKTKKVVIPSSHFEFYIKNTVNLDNDKKQEVIFRNKRSNEVIGIIKPKHFFWSEQLVQLRSLILALKGYRKDDRSTDGKAPGLGSITKW